MQQSNPIIGSSYFLMVITLFLLNSCQSKLTEEELKGFIKNPENGLIKEKTVNNVAFSVNYRPTTLLVAQELNRGGKSGKEIEALHKKYEQYLYFNLNISQNNAEILSNAIANKNTYKRTLHQLLNNMSQHVCLINDKNDTLNIVDYVYPRVYGQTNSTNMMFIFNKNPWDNTDFVKLCVNEFGLNTGTTKYKFLKKDLDNIPQLKL